jgi:hypothetical protein
MAEPQALQQVTPPRPAGIDPDDLPPAAAVWTEELVQGEQAFEQGRPREACGPRRPRGPVARAGVPADLDGPGALVDRWRSRPRTPIWVGRARGRHGRRFGAAGGEPTGPVAARVRAIPIGVEGFHR